MSERRWPEAGPAPDAGQWVSGSFVTGDLILVSGVGGDVKITSDRPPYRVEAFDAAPTPISAQEAREQPSRLLLARHEVVEFSGRDELLGDLAKWLGGPGAISVQLLHAAGGQGKTRLARYVAAACVSEGWAAWQVRHTATSAGGRRVDMPGHGSVIAVVDYADRWPVTDLLALMGHFQTMNLRTGVKVRVLMLSRSGGYWWQALSVRLGNDFAISAGGRALLPLGAQVDRPKLFRTARQRFAAAMQVAGTDDLPLPDSLDLAAFGQILAVHMAALVAVDAHWRGRTVPNHPHSLSAYLLRREYDYWYALHDQDGGRRQTTPEMMGRAVYIATLTGPIPRGTARAVLNRVKVTEPGVDTVIDDHRFCYPPANAALVLEALRPDRLGEDLVALSTPGHPYVDEGEWPPDDWAGTAVRDMLNPTDRSALAWTPNAMSVLVEAAYRWEHIARTLLYPLLAQHPALALAAGGAAIARIADLPNVSPVVLEALDRVMPTGRHLDLDGAAAAISTPLTRYRLSRATEPAEKARIFVTHAERLARVGRMNDARVAAEEAVRICRQLADANRPVHSPDLAEALTVLSVCLGQGRRRDALAAVEEAADLYRGLAEANPNSYRNGLAGALANLAVNLWESGRREEALAPAVEAVSIRRQLAESNAIAHLASLGTCLTNLSMYLSSLGRDEEALSPATEAADLYGGLARADPAAYLDGLAVSLATVAMCLSRSGRPADALTAGERSTGIYRRLAEANAAAHLPGLAGSLSNLSIYRRHEKPEEAQAAAEEAVVLCRDLAKANPAAYLPDLGASLINLSNQLPPMKSHDAALAPAEEAARIYRQLAEVNPAAHLPDLATSLTTVGGRLAELGRPAEALIPLEEAAEINLRLVRVNSPAHLPGLAISLSNQAVCLSQLGRDSEALAVKVEVVRAYRVLTGTNSAAYASKLADSLNDLSVLEAAVNHHSEAVDAVKEAVEIRRRIAEAAPETYLPSLAASLNDLGGRLATVGRWEEALTVAREAVDLCRHLAETEPVVYLRYLDTSLTNLQACLSRLGRSDEARVTAQEATRIHRQMTEASSETGPAEFADPLRGAVQEAIGLLELMNGRQSSDTSGPWRLVKQRRRGKETNDEGR